MDKLDFVRWVVGSISDFYFHGRKELQFRTIVSKFWTKITVSKLDWLKDYIKHWHNQWSSCKFISSWVNFVYIKFLVCLTKLNHHVLNCDWKLTFCGGPPDQFWNYRFNLSSVAFSKIQCWNWIYFHLTF